MAHSASNRALPSGAAEPQLPSVAVRALHHFEPHGSFSIRQGSPFRCSRAAAPFGRSESPPSDVSNHAKYSAARGTLPSGAAEPQLPSDAGRVPHLAFHCAPHFASSHNLFFLHCTRIFGGLLTISLRLLSHVITFFWGVLWVRALS